MTDDKFIEILRHMRHDFGNHLQVISGYLDLGRTEEVKNYIQSIVLENSEERLVFTACSPANALYFYEQMLEARESGIKLLFQDIDISSVELLEKHQEPLHSILQLAQNNRDTRLINVSIRESGPGVLLYLKPDNQEEPVIVSVME